MNYRFTHEATQQEAICIFSWSKWAVKNFLKFQPVIGKIIETNFKFVIIFEHTSSSLYRHSCATENYKFGK